MRYLFFMLIFFSVSASALSSRQGGDVDLVFHSEGDRARYEALVNELRCPKCQNQSIADSDSPISQDLRQVVYEQVSQGESDQAILDFLKARYGEFIHYEPPKDVRTAPLWIGPFGLLLVGLWVWFRAWRSTQKKEQKGGEA